LDNNLDGLLSLLRRIKTCPNKYIRNKSLNELHAMIGGYLYRQYELDGDLEKLNYFNGFQQYVQDKYEVSSAQSWSRIIEFFSVSNDDAFDDFYALLDEYIEKTDYVMDNEDVN